MIKPSLVFFCLISAFFFINFLEIIFQLTVFHNYLEKPLFPRACLKNHSYNLHAPICGIFCLHSVDVARYAALIQAKSPTNCNAHLAESIFQTHSSQNTAH